jgi:hypothetical protein
MSYRSVFLLIAGLLPAATAACGGNVVVDPIGKGGSATASSTSVSGAGGEIFMPTTGPTTVTTTSGPTTVTATSSSGGLACAASSQVVVYPNMGPAQATFTSVCASAVGNPDMISTAYGYLVLGGVNPGMSSLQIYGCQSASIGSEGVYLTSSDVKGPGTFANGLMYFTDAMGGLWSSVKSSLTVTKIGPVGDTIEGYFNGAFAEPSHPNLLVVKGTFSVCHGPDLAGP